MKRIFLTAAGMMALLHSYAQTAPADTGRVSRKLKLDEVNLVSSYYHQNGNNSAVTGGIGSEKLTDISNVIDVTLVQYDKKNRKNKFNLDVGVDHYTSASSDMIDMKANSSASHADTRFYPSVGWMRENEARGSTLMGGASFSTEFDYRSYGANIGFAQKTTNKMGEFTAKLQAYIDEVTLVTPIELRTGNIPGNNERDDEHYGSSGRNTFALSLAYSQIINPNFQVELLADVVQQSGFLSLPFHRVYFTDGTVHQENLPGKRFKTPLGLRANYFLGDKLIIRTYYRYYTDDWGIHSHTINLETPVKLSPFVSVSPFYRFYAQTAAKYFASYKEHTARDEFYTSNYDLSGFNSSFFGAGIRYNLPNGLFGIQQVNMVELRYGHYTKSAGMASDIISLNVRIK